MNGNIHHVEIEVRDYGKMTLELDAGEAPLTVANFLKLARSGFYDGLTFHRIIYGFMIQGGDPEGTGFGGSDETVKGEFRSNGVDNKISHVKGVISMARSSNPNSASSQFFITVADATFLDGEYAAFGMVIVTVLLGNLILNKLHFSFEGQPIAHTDGLWNFLGMVVVGWGSTLLGGCPLRQLILSGEGNADSAVTVLGMIFGAAMSHNFKLASSGDGSTENGHIAVWLALAALLVVSVVCTFMRKEKKHG